MKDKEEYIDKPVKLKRKELEYWSVQDIDHGRVVLTIEDQLKKKGITRTQLKTFIGITGTQMKKYCENGIERVDLDILARICYVLNCQISDILRFEMSPK